MEDAGVFGYGGGSETEILEALNPLLFQDGMSPRQTIAHYRILSKLGEGGMGTVYRALDTKLNREVSIKVLPEVFASDADRAEWGGVSFGHRTEREEFCGGVGGDAEGGKANVHFTFLVSFFDEVARKTARRQWGARRDRPCGALRVPRWRGGDTSKIACACWTGRTRCPFDDGYDVVGVPKVAAAAPLIVDAYALGVPATLHTLLN